MPEYLVKISPARNLRFLGPIVYNKAAVSGYSPVVLGVEDGLFLRTQEKMKKFHKAEIEAIPGILTIEPM